MNPTHTKRAPLPRQMQEHWLKRKHGLAGPRAGLVADLAFGGDRRK
ncbi:MAG: hypothetical protein AAGO57_03830 [Pseudomonadota bacterium]